MTHFIVQTACAQMPSSVKATYRRVAVLEVREGTARASMISERSRDVLQIVETWERLHVGTTARCAYERALAEAEKMAARLNSCA